MIYTLYRLKRIKYVVKIMQIGEEKLFWENTKNDGRAYEVFNEIMNCIMGYYEMPMH